MHTTTGSGDDSTKPVVTFSNDPEPADILLNETTILQCNISIPAKTYLRRRRTGWIINGVKLELVIPQHPECDLNSSLWGSDSEV